ncbi:uncharacterized protein LOC113518895 [Galleria mellonella]|uniref:Uncharacterized protein LOC113518895 n=1 Tax=Galleria mellonella TaxID=7137 RepID=A0A6J1X1Y4_GALME|nr:uncharacterized protein LOC113518895 [Galleria mellonella]
MSSVYEDWSEESCIQLIREYRARPILWDTKDPFFFKKTMKPQLWEEIGKALNVSADVCKHKMSILMSSFRREKAKIMRSIKDEKDLKNMYKSTWFAFKEMVFLMDKETERKRQSTGIDDDDDDAPSLKKTLLNHHLQPPISNTAQKSRPSPEIRKEMSKMINKFRVSNDIPQTNKQNSPPPAQPTAGPSQVTSESDEEIKSFANFIAFKMKKYPEATKNAVQQEICNVIFRADQNYFAKCYEQFMADSEEDPLDGSERFEIENETKIECESDISDY